MNPIVPAPVAENVQTKVCEAPTATVTGPAGAGPLRRATSAAPGPAAIRGRTPETSALPVLVTVSATVSTPSSGTAAGAASAAARTPPPTVTTPEVRPVVETVQPPWPSSPVTVAVKVIVPGDVTE
mgnify:CR=1 FL=1